MDAGAAACTFNLRAIQSPGSPDGAGRATLLVGAASSLGLELGRGEGPVGAAGESVVLLSGGAVRGPGSREAWSPGSGRWWGRSPRTPASRAEAATGRRLPRRPTSLAIAPGVAAGEPMHEALVQMVLLRRPALGIRRHRLLPIARHHALADCPSCRPCHPRAPQGHAVLCGHPEVVVVRCCWRTGWRTGGSGSAVAADAGGSTSHPPGSNAVSRRRGHAPGRDGTPRLQSSQHMSLRELSLREPPHTPRPHPSRALRMRRCHKTDPLPGQAREKVKSTPGSAPPAYLPATRGQQLDDHDQHLQGDAR